MAWRVTLDGDAAELTILADSFKGPGLAINKEDSAFTLSCPEFEALNDAMRIRERAMAIVKLLNGATRLGFDSLQAIACGSVQETTAEGNRKIYGFPEPVVVHARVFVGAVVMEQDGKVVSRSHPGDSICSWMQLASQDIDVGKVLTLLSTGIFDWSNLYRIFEIIRSDAGGEDEIQKRGWATGAALTLFRRTSNHPEAAGLGARHGVMDAVPPVAPMDLEEAKALIVGLVHGWLRWKSGRREERMLN
jgi:hypothetical protein